MNTNLFAANVIYNDAIKEEIKWREDKNNSHDIELIDKIIAEINGLGYDLKYEADLRLRDINDKRIIPIVSKYLLQFENDGFAEGLIGIIAKRNFYESTPLVLELYEKIRNASGDHQSLYCDNALYDIKDKQYINKYLEFLQNESDASRLPLTMTMLAKWNVPEAKKFFLHYLDAENRELVFTAIECLGYYKDDSSIITALNNHLNSNDKDIIKAIKKALKKLEITK